MILCCLWFTVLFICCFVVGCFDWLRDLFGLRFDFSFRLVFVDELDCLVGYVGEILVGLFAVLLVFCVLVGDLFMVIA